MDNRVSKLISIAIQAAGTFVPVVLVLLFGWMSLKVIKIVIVFSLLWNVVNLLNIVLERIQGRFRFVDLLKKMKWFILMWLALWIVGIGYRIFTFVPIGDETLYDRIEWDLSLLVIISIWILPLFFSFARDCSASRTLVVGVVVLALTPLLLFACGSPDETGSRSDAAVPKETVQEQTASERLQQEGAPPNNIEWYEEFAQGMACGEGPDGNSHCVPYHPDPELDSIIKMCKNDSPESCKIERRKKIKEHHELRKKAKANVAK